MSESPVPSTPLLQTSHVQYLEQINDQEFWRHAAELAIAPSGAIPDVDGYLACPYPRLPQSDHVSEHTDEQGPGKLLVSLTHLREVIAVPRHFTYLPASPHWMSGITAWHRNSIAVIDLVAYITQQPGQIQEKSFILIAQHDAITLGFATPIIDTVPAFPPDHLQPFDKYMVPPSYHGTDAILGTYADAFVLHLPTILASIVQELRTVPV